MKKEVKNMKNRRAKIDAKLATLGVKKAGRVEKSEQKWALRERLGKASKK